MTTPSPSPRPATHETPPTAASPLITVFPVRFSDDPAAMIDFTALLGLAPLVTTDRNSFGELRAGAGALMVHRAAGSETASAAGETHLDFTTDDLDAARSHLEALGLQARVWDESYGRQGCVLGRLGEELGINETQTDLYGYIGHEDPRPDPGVTVVAVRSSADPDADEAFFAGLGFTSDGLAAPDYRELAGGPGAGSIGLHAPIDGLPVSREGRSDFGDVALARLSFSTAEDLAVLVDRLRAAGHEARLVEDGARAVHVTDPDGQHVEIHPHPVL